VKSIFKKHFSKKTLAILLALTFLLPTAGLTVAAQEPVQDQFGIVIPVEQGLARGAAGITPEQLNDMAIDPQSWRFPHDTRHSPIPSRGVTTDTRRTDLGPDGDIADDRDSFVPHPVVDWQHYRAIHDDLNDPRTFDDLLDFPAGMERRTIRAAVILVEYPDMPMFSSRPQGSELMGNPMVDTRIYHLEGAERTEALQEFWENFLNEYVPELNRGHNITGGWMEYSAGLWDLELSVYGPIMMPHFRFMYSPNGTFWSGTTSAAHRAVWGNFNFHGQFPTAGVTGTALAAQLAVAQGVPLMDENGPRYETIFYTLAGYCQSPTWQEFGTMMFPAVDQIVATTEVAHPVTREILPNVTGLDFTGYAHVRNLHARVSAPGFHIDEFGPDFFMTNVEAGWRTYISTGVNSVAFTSTRAIHEGLFARRNEIPAVVVPTSITVYIEGVPTTLAVPGNATARTVGSEVAAAYIEFRTQFPNANRTPVQFQTDVFRPAFLNEFALQNRYEGPSMAYIAPVIDAIESLGALTIEVAGEEGANTAAANTARTAAIAGLIRALPSANVEGVVLRFDLFGATGNDWTTGNFRAHVIHGFEVVTVNLNIAGFVPPGDAIMAFGASLTDYSEFVFETEPEYAEQENHAMRIDGVWYVGGEIFEGDVEDLDESYFPFLVHPDALEAGAALLDRPVGIMALSATARPAWTAFQYSRSHEVVTPRLIELLEEAMDEAANHPTNPFFQAAPTRYVPWTSWYGVFGVWSHATSINIFHPATGNVSVPIAVQGEGAAMAVYSHELGHVVRLPDNDNMVYNLGAANAGAGIAGQPIPARSQLGPWNIMARGAHVGYYGGHTRWNIPGIRAGSSGTGLMTRMRIGSGFTDLTDMQGPVPGSTGQAAQNMRNWVRPDPENSLDIKYVRYTDFRSGPPVVAEVHGRNIPTNRGFVDYYGDPIDGFTGLIIQGVEFSDQTPGALLPNSHLYGTGNALRWATNLLGVDIGIPANQRPLSGLQRSPVHASGDPLVHRATIIDPARWNWSIGGGPTMQTTANTYALTGLNPAATRRQHGFSIDVINRVGSDSFNPDHGVLISRIGHTNLVGQGNMDGAGIYVIDAHPGNNMMIQFHQPDGTPYFFGCEHHVQIANATFRAGLHNNPDYYRDLFPERFLPIAPCGDCPGGCRSLPSLMAVGIAPPGGLGADPMPCYDPRPGFAGNTVNEWVDEFNNFHFYILQRNNHRGRFGEFMSYDVAVRNTAANAYVVGGELELVTVGEPLVASPGNFSAQRFAITACDDATATDIIRVVLDGELAEYVTVTTAGGYTHKAHTMDQNVVLLNNLFAIEPGETIEFDLFIRVPADHTGVVFDTTGRLDVKVVSETNPDKYAYAGGVEVNVPFTLSFNIFNNGNNNNVALTNLGVIRMWPQINGVGANLTYANLTVTAEDQDGAPAMQFVRINRIWNNQGYVNMIDVNKHAPWQYIDLTVEYRGQTFEVQLINNMFLSLRAFNNGTCDEVPGLAGMIRIWPQLGGVGAPIPMSTVFTAIDQDGGDAIDLITRNRQWVDGTGWQDNYINFDVDKSAAWETITLTVSVFGQDVEVLLINNLFAQEQLPVLGLNAFNNGNSNNASLAGAGIIRIWTQLDGVNALIPFEGLIVTATDQDNVSFIEYVRVNRVWNNTNYVNMIDVTKRDANWETMDLTVTLGTGQTVTLALSNDLFE